MKGERELAHDDRKAVLDQLSYLLEEIEAMNPVMGRLHEAELINSERGPSVKECYGAIVEWDRGKVLPAVGGEKKTDLSEVNWNGQSLQGILARVAAEREQVILLCSGLGDERWEQSEGPGSIRALLYATIQHDTNMLRKVAEQLHRGW